jgi:hypothetical protein
MQHLVGSVEGFSRRVETWEIELINATQARNTANKNLDDFYIQQGGRLIRWRSPEMFRMNNLQNIQRAAQERYDKAVAIATTKRAERDAAERERQRKIKEEQDARERRRVKGLAESAYNTAVTAATNARADWIKQKDEFDDADKKIPPLQTSYNNVQRAFNDARAKKGFYDSAMEQKNTASNLLTTATNAFATAKAKVKSAWETAETVAKNARTTYNAQKKEYDTAVEAIPALKSAYDNAQNAIINAREQKTIYDAATSQQTAANALLKAATDELTRINTKTQGDINKQFAEHAEYIKNAVVFPNALFGLDSKYNTMSINWTAYTAAKDELATVIETNKIVDITAATDRLVETYNKFIASKDIYSSSVLSALKSSTRDSDYIRNNEVIATTYEGVYGLRSKEYRPMVDAWVKTTKSIDESDISGTLANYSRYLVAKTRYSSALLVAQNKQAEAEFQTKLAAGREAAAQWAKSGAGGCRNIQTTATLDPDMLDQNITCSNTEYISGYSKVSGFYAAPADPVSKNNIARYLAVKYSCCAVPVLTKGPQGRKGLPGVEGAQGATGPTGEDGIFGKVGIRGERGNMGEEGGKGPRGDSGEDGISGEQGLPGLPGKSVKMPIVTQVPGPAGPTGQRGPMGIQGPKGKDGVSLPAPKQPPSDLDKTISLFDMQEKINKYMRG